MFLTSKSSLPLLAMLMPSFGTFLHAADQGGGLGGAGMASEAVDAEAAARYNASDWKLLWSDEFDGPGPV